MKTKASIIQDYIASHRAELVLPPPKQKRPRTSDDLKMWRIQGLPRCLSNNQIWRLATVECGRVGCRVRFVQRTGPGRPRRHCSRRCRNMAHYKRKISCSRT